MRKDIIAIDPGVTTGVAHMRFTDEVFEVVNVWQLGDPDGVWEELHDIITHVSDTATEDVIVLCESFEIRPDVVSPDETPKYIIKDIERFIEPDYQIEYQMASQAKVGIPPGRDGQRDRLHAFGVYQRGMRHSNDAIRHILVYAIEKLRHRPLIVKGWGLPGRRK